MGMTITKKQEMIDLKALSKAQYGKTVKYVNVCMVTDCGYVSDGMAANEFCPKCGGIGTIKTVKEK